MKPYSHITRALAIIASIIVIVAIVRSELIPSSYGKFGEYRADHLTEEMASTPIHQGDESCLDCHEKEWDVADGRHAEVPCENCHFLPAPHAEAPPGEFSMADSALKESRRIAELIFQSRYAVMNEGGDKEKIHEMITVFDNNEGEKTVRVFRGEPVIGEFGEMAGEREIWEADPDLSKTLLEGEEIMQTLAETIRYIQPVTVKEECLECHTQASVGDISGVIELTFPVGGLKIKRYKKVADMPADRSREACANCHRSLSSRPKKFPQVKNMDGHVKEYWKEKLGPFDPEALCLKCHKAHFPRIVKGASVK